LDEHHGDGERWKSTNIPPCGWRAFFVNRHDGSPMSYGRNYAREALLHLCPEKQRFNLVEES
jgi:hypothetical protein